MHCTGPSRPRGSTARLSSGTSSATPSLTSARSTTAGSRTTASTRSISSGRGRGRGRGNKKPRSSTERKMDRKRAEDANYIPRPRNSFILFRNDFVERHKQRAEALGLTTAAVSAAAVGASLGRRASSSSDDDDDEGGTSRTLSKQASDIWNNMSDAEKAPWQEAAEDEKREHAKKYPNYRFRPKRQLSHPQQQCQRRDSSSAPSSGSMGMPREIPEEPEPD